MDPVLILGTAVLYAGIMMFGAFILLRPQDMVIFMDKAEVPASRVGMRAVGVLLITSSVMMLFGFMAAEAIVALIAFWTLMTAMMLKKSDFEDVTNRTNITLHAIKNGIIIGMFLHLWSHGAAGNLWHIGM